MLAGVALGDEEHVRRIVREEHRLDGGEAGVADGTGRQPIVLRVESTTTPGVAARVDTAFFGPPR